MAMVVAVACVAPQAGAGGRRTLMPDEVAGRLEAVGPAHMTLSYEVLLPSADDPIVYDVDIWAAPAAGDTLCRSEYLIEWSLPTPSGRSNGFSAYSDGHHYRYRDGRLQEYHFDWDPAPFVAAHGGVQGNAQFADLTPQALAAQLRAMAADTTYTVVMAADTLYNRQRADVMQAAQSIGGYDCRNIMWVLDPATSMPRVIGVESNPAQISEQLLTVRFSDIDMQAEMPGLDEESLIARYPDVFGECRESNFAITSMPGKQLPTFSAPTPGGERYTYHKGEALAAPTIIWLLDPGVGGTADVIAATREAIDMLPMNADAIYAFVTNNIDDIDGVIERERPGEHILMTARSLARDCGVTAYPMAMTVNTDGVVTDVILGVNKSLSESVMMKLSGALGK